ncbi:MAG: N-formylglutamate amidohydrolase, partial [Pseudomonadota bacterium]|nr:N-formylglutamate amidohydrolase [Pseudomonadota bacterium]
TSFIKECFTNQNMLVSCNEPYSGGYTTIHYGKPSGGVHALQIEISRSLYMDEASRTKHGGFAALISKITEVLSCIKSADWP